MTLGVAPLISVALISDRTRLMSRRRLQDGRKVAFRSPSELTVEPLQASALAGHTETTGRGPLRAMRSSS